MGHCLAENIICPPPFPTTQSFPPFHPPKFHSIAQHSSFPEPPQAFLPHSTPYNPYHKIISSSMFNSWCCVKRSDIIFQILLRLLIFVVFQQYFAFLPYKEGVYNQTDLIFELADPDYIYPNHYFSPLMCLVYLQYFKCDIVPGSVMPHIL